MELTTVVPLLLRDACEDALSNLLPANVVAIKFASFTVLDTESFSGAKSNSYDASEQMRVAHIGKFEVLFRGRYNIMWEVINGFDEV